MTPFNARYVVNIQVMELKGQLLVPFVVNHHSLLRSEIVRVVGVDDGKLAWLETCMNTELAMDNDALRCASRT